MKYLLLALLCAINMTSLSAQEDVECAKFEIVGVYDFNPSPQTPGGKQILVMMTATEDIANNFNPFYASMQFVYSSGEALTILTGPSLELPQFAADTFLYILEIRDELGLHDFPDQFDGELVITVPTGPPFPAFSICRLPYARGFSTTWDHHERQNEVKIFPNPISEYFQIYSDMEIAVVLLYDSFGRIISFEQSDKIYTINKLGNAPKFFFVAIHLKNGSTVHRKLMSITER